jgi:phage/plasmid-like protein (TIGR03299 family)
MQESKWKKVGMEIDAENIDEALEQCGCNWGVQKKDLAIAGERTIDGIPVIGQDVPMKGIVRVDNGDVLGVVGQNYEPIQNRESFQFFDELVQEKEAKYTYGGMLPSGAFGDGSQVFLTAEMDNMQIGPDECKKMLILTTAHNGTSGVNVQFLVYRLVCSNGLIAIDKGASSTVSIRHTKNYNDRIHNARMVLGTSQLYFDKMEEVFNLFYETSFSDGQMKDLARKLYPDVENKTNTARENRRDELFRLFHQGAGHDQIANTQWAAYNAVAESVDHRTGKDTKKGSNVNEFNSVLTGTAAKVKDQAYHLLVA